MLDIVKDDGEEFLKSETEEAILRNWGWSDMGDEDEEGGFEFSS